MIAPSKIAKSFASGEINCPMDSSAFPSTDTSGAADAIEFAAGIAAGDIRVDQSADGKTITLRIAGTGDRIAIEDALGSGRIEEIRFSDGTTIDVESLFPT